MSVTRHLVAVHEGMPVVFRPDAWPIVLPEHLEERWAANVVLPIGTARPLLIDATRCQSWTDRGVAVLGQRLTARHVGYLPHPDGLNVLLLDASIRYARAVGL